MNIITAKMTSLEEEGKISCDISAVCCLSLPYVLDVRPRPH